MRIYTPEPLPDLYIHPAFYFKYPPQDKGGGLFRDVEQTYFKEFVVDDATSADAIVLPNNFVRKLDDVSQAYVSQHSELSKKLNIPIFVFSCADFTDDIVFDAHIWVFRYSVYRSSMGAKDIVVPTVTEDPPQSLIFLRDKRSRPVVSFCGQGGFKTRKEWLKFELKNALFDVESIFSPPARAKKLGVYWRRAMMRACRNSPLIETNFIVRNSFSGHRATIELDPKQARQEYLETTAHADFVLAPKGDGNYSNRFIKTLAFGRIPVVVDTDIILPLEEVIDYSKISIRVPMDDVKNTPRYVSEFYASLSPAEWQERQTMAKSVFDTYLKQDSFFRYFFNTKMRDILS